LERHHGVRLDVRVAYEFGSEGPPEGFADVLSTDELDEWRRHDEQRNKSLEVSISPVEPMTAGRLLAAGRDAYAIFEAHRGGSIGASGARDLLRGGRAELLLGLAESDWLEVKSHAYPFTVSETRVVDAAKIELAQDVARFANGDRDALLIVGISTKVVNDSEILDRVVGAPLELLRPKQYEDVIDQRVYPAVLGMTIEQIDLGDGKGLLAVFVPKQPDASLPFLVHGAIVGERIERTFISIVRRRGDGTIPITPSQIHSQLVAGRGVIERRDQS
jgi:hypothetical protein